MKSVYLSDQQFALLLILPVFAFNVAVIGYPLAYSLMISFTDFSAINKSMAFVGLEQYEAVLSNAFVRTSLITTAKFAMISIIFTVSLSLAIALALNENFFGRGILRTVALLPWAVSEFSTSIIWNFMYSQDYGALNGLLYSLHLIPSYQAWLRPETAIYLVCLAWTWHYAPLCGFFMLSALQAIPADLYRAARIDGAGPTRRFLHVTVPRIKYAILIVLVLVTIQSFRVFDIVYMMTQGGPGMSTTVASYYIYLANFLSYNFSFASALAYLLSLITIVLGTAYFLLLTRKPRRRIVSAPTEGGTSH